MVSSATTSSCGRPYGAQFQQVADIISRFAGVIVSVNDKADKAVIINAVTISQNLGDMQRAIASIQGASGVRVDPDGRGDVIVSGNATDAVTAQAILDRARGLAGPYWPATDRSSTGSTR